MFFVKKGLVASVFTSRTSQNEYLQHPIISNIFVQILSDVVHQFFSIFGHYCPWPHFMIHLRPNGCPRDSADIDCSNGRDIAQIFCKYQTYMI